MSGYQFTLNPCIPINFKGLRHHCERQRVNIKQLDVSDPRKPLENFLNNYEGSLTIALTHSVRGFFFFTAAVALPILCYNGMVDLTDVAFYSIEAGSITALVATAIGYCYRYRSLYRATNISRLAESVIIATENRPSHPYHIALQATFLEVLHRLDRKEWSRVLCHFKYNYSHLFAKIQNDAYLQGLGINFAALKITPETHLFELPHEHEGKSAAKALCLILIIIIFGTIIGYGLLPETYITPLHPTIEFFSPLSATAAGFFMGAVLLTPPFSASRTATNDRRCSADNLYQLATTFFRGVGSSQERKGHLIAKIQKALGCEDRLLILLLLQFELNYKLLGPQQQADLLEFFFGKTPKKLLETLVYGAKKIAPAMKGIILKFAIDKLIQQNYGSLSSVNKNVYKSLSDRDIDVCKAIINNYRPGDTLIDNPGFSFERSLFFAQ